MSVLGCLCDRFLTLRIFYLGLLRCPSINREMHRLFDIAELLREIAMYLGVLEWGSLVSVSRRWNLVILPLLWRRVDFGVFSVFGSFERDAESGYYTVSYPVCCAFSVAHWC